MSAQSAGESEVSVLLTFFPSLHWLGRTLVSPKTPSSIYLNERRDLHLRHVKVVIEIQCAGGYAPVASMLWTKFLISLRTILYLSGPLPWAASGFI
jgi:hypothetical protein